MVNRVGGTEFTRQRQPMCVHINRDDRIAAGDLCRHQSRQSDGADAEDREAVAGLRLHGVENRSSAGLAAAGKWSQDFQRSVLANLDRVTLLSERISTERRLLKEGAINRPAAFR